MYSRILGSGRKKNVANVVLGGVRVVTLSICSHEYIVFVFVLFEQMQYVPVSKFSVMSERFPVLNLFQAVF